jgi:uncharacterized protein (TIGR02300 family)
VAKPELGTKRQCQSCGAKFYDLSKDPIVCPKCGTTYVAAAMAAPTRGRAAEVANREEDEDTDEAAAGPELVSLDEVEAEESGKDIPGDDVEIEDDIAEDDDTFLEEEEAGDDDVADLIDGEIEDDEEA